MKLHDFIARPWTPPDFEQIMGFVKVRGDLVIVTDFAVYRAVEEETPLGYAVHRVAVL